MQLRNPLIAPSLNGVMAGFPPAADKHVTLATAYQPEHLGYRVQNITRLFPTARISRGEGPIVPLERAGSLSIDELSVEGSNGEAALLMPEVLERTGVDSMIVMHRGKIVYEGYYGDMDSTKVHAMYSCTKSVVGLLVEAFIHNGALDQNALASHYIPELNASPAGSATLRQLLDMRANFMFSDKPKVNGRVQADYIMRLGFIPSPADHPAATGVYDLLQGARPMGPHGGPFRYDNGSTDTLGWVLRKVTGASLDRLISDLIWSRLGAERDASMTVDAGGTEWAGAGMGAILRDFARLGEMLRCSGEVNGQQLFHADVFSGIRQGGDPSIFGEGNEVLPGGSYRSQWWFYHDRHASFACRGQYGQRLWVAPGAETMIAQFAADPNLSALEPLRLRGFQAIADALR